MFYKSKKNLYLFFSLNFSSIETFYDKNSIITKHLNILYKYNNLLIRGYQLKDMLQNQINFINVIYSLTLKNIPLALYHNNELIYFNKNKVYNKIIPLV